MVIKIQRLSPVYICSCVCEEEVEYDDLGNVVTPPQFLLMNYVCDRHWYMATKTIKDMDLHKEMARHVLDLIEQTKSRNLKQVNDLIAKATRVLQKLDLIACREQVIEHNRRLDIEWQELAAFPFAFDAHIYDQIRLEDKERQSQAKKQMMILAYNGAV